MERFTAYRTYLLRRFCFPCLGLTFSTTIMMLIFLPFAMMTFEFLTAIITRQNYTKSTHTNHLASMIAEVFTSRRPYLKPRPERGTIIRKYLSFIRHRSPVGMINGSPVFTFRLTGE